MGSAQRNPVGVFVFEHTTRERSFRDGGRHPLASRNKTPLRIEDHLGVAEMDNPRRSADSLLEE